MLKRLILLFSIFFVLSTLSYAQVEKGDSEVIFSAMFMSIVGVEDYSSMTGSLNLNYGYFLTDNFEIGIGPTITYTKSTSTFLSYDPNTFSLTEEKYTSETANVSATAFFNFNFSTSSKTVPYITGQWFQTDFDPEDDMKFSDYSYINVGFGVRNFINEYAALNTSVNYGFSLAENAEGGVILALTGVSVIF